MFLVIAYAHANELKFTEKMKKNVTVSNNFVPLLFA